MPDTIDNPLRRRLLAGATAAIATGAAIATAAHAAPVASPENAGADAELIAACHRFLATDAELHTLHGEDFEDDGRGAHVLDIWYAHLERLTAIQAQTPAGIHAKARSAFVALQSTEPGMGLQREEAAALAALADLLGRTNA